MFASSFHHWTSTSDSPRNANSTSCRLQVGWPGRRSALTRSGITDRSPDCRRRTSIPTLLSAGGPYLGPARLGAVEGATAGASSLSGPVIGSTVGAIAWETGSVPGDWITGEDWTAVGNWTAGGDGTTGGDCTAGEDWTAVGNWTAGGDGTTGGDCTAGGDWTA